MSWLSVCVLIPVHAGVSLFKVNHKSGQKTSAAQVLRKAGLRLALAASLISTVATPATPYEIPTTPSGNWTGSGITTGTVTFGGGTLGAETGSYFKTTPSGLRMTITVDGTFPPGSGSYFFTTPPNTNTTGLNPTAAGTSPGPFTTIPVMPNGANPIWLLESVFTCKTNFPASTSCPGIGTVKVTFTDPLGGLVPVVQPKIHVTRLGGTVGAMELGAGFQTSSSGLAATAAATATLAVKNGNEFYGNPTPVGNTLNVDCGVSPTTTAGCGTVQITGTASTLNFTVNAYRTTAGGNAWGDGADGFFFDMSFDEDFGSAPTTYEGGGVAAANLLTDLRLGTTVSAENTATAADANGGATGAGLLTVSPLAAAAGAIPGDSNDGVTLPLLTTSMVGTTYTLTPTMSGASRAGVTCGWIDFDANGTFTPASEGVCAAFAAGATSAPLNFTVPAAGVAAGPTYARFRTTYDTAMTTSAFNGLFSSGETEDYQIHIKPVVKVVKAIVPPSDTGTFNLLINGTSFASAVGNAGTTSFKTIYHTDTPDVTVATNIRNAAITGVALTETAAGASVLADYITTSACVDANNTAVATGGTPAAPTVTIPQSAAGNAKAQTVTCTLTNSRLPKLQVTKTSNGGVGAFTFTGTNGWTSQTITTVTSGTAVSGAVQTLSAASTATTLTEAIPAGYVMSAASCSGLGAGTATPNLAAGTIALNAAATAAGNAVVCSVTNTKLPTLTLVKTITNDNGGAATLATFPLTATGPTTITGVSGTAAVTSQLVGTGTYALSETTSPTYAASAWSCTAGTLTGSSLVLAAGQVSTCTINNNDIAPTLALRKTTTGGVSTFNFSGTNGFGSDSITTLVAGTAVSGATKTLALGNTATDFTETVTSGYFLNGAPTCSGMGTGGTVAFVSGSTYRLNAAATANASNIICSFANTLAAPQLAVAKSASVASINAAGQTITYTIVVSNPGNVTVTAITVADPLGAVICAVSGNATIASLAPTASQNCTITYVVTQAIINSNGGGTGKINNTATASGSYGATSVTANGSTSVTIIRNPLLTIVKTASTATPQPAGAVITYTYKATNSGNVTMSAVGVTDAHNGSGVLVGPTNETLTTDASPLGDSTDGGINGTWNTLAPGDAVTFTATYTVTQNDVDTLQ